MKSKGKSIDQLKNPDLTGNYYELMTIVFPNKAVLELKREKFGRKESA